MDRRLAAILATDVVGYSRLMAVDEAATHTRLMQLLAEIVDPRIAERNGRIVKKTGDGALIEFTSVVDAVECAVAIQTAMAELNADQPEESRMLFRMGINLGDIIVEPDDIYGDGVNVAARLESLAEPGGICISGEVYRLVRNKLDLDFSDRGWQELKNIPEPVQIFHIGQVGGQVEPSRPAGQKALLRLGSVERQEASSSMVSVPPFALPHDKPAIVVLPFRNLNRDPEQDYFCDGLTEDITTDLSKFANLLVIAAHSAFAYKGKSIGVQEIRQALGVRYLLEGTVQRSGRRVRVNAKLIDTAGGHQLWGERFDRDMEDIFAVQDEIIQRIVAALAIKVDAAERERALHKETNNINAYDAYLRGVHHYSIESEGALEKCRAMFQRAAEVDPNFARAWGYIAYTHVQRWICGWGDDSELDQAEEHARTAVLLDPDDYANHWDLAFVYLNKKQFDRAMREYETALRLNNNDADMLVEMAEMLYYVGDIERGIEQIQHAVRLNPYTPDWYRWILGWGYYLLKRYDEAIDELDRMIRPPSQVQLVEAAAYAQRGDLETAGAKMARFREQRPDWTLERERQTLAFKRREDEEHWIDGLRKAGLPDGPPERQDT